MHAECLKETVVWNGNAVMRKKNDALTLNGRHLEGRNAGGGIPPFIYFYTAVRKTLFKLSFSLDNEKDRSAKQRDSGKNTADMTNNHLA